jgi:hypothetical protein
VAMGRSDYQWAAKTWTSTAFFLAGAGIGAGLYFGNLSYVKSSTPPPVNSQSSPVLHSQLLHLLLPSAALGPTAITVSAGTDPSTLSGICGGPRPGLIAAETAYETIADLQTGTYLYEVVASWPSLADAGQAIAIDRLAVEQSGSCTFTYSGATTVYTGDVGGSPPSSCLAPGQYFATQVQASTPSSKLPYRGFSIEVQCGTSTISVQLYSDLLGSITQLTADGYLSDAIGQLDSATS